MPPNPAPTTAPLWEAIDSLRVAAECYDSTNDGVHDEIALEIRRHRRALWDLAWRIDESDPFLEEARTNLLRGVINGICIVSVIAALIYYLVVYV